MDKICLGLPAYGAQTPNWWKPLLIQVSELYKQNIELVDILDATVMATDYARNSISYRFLDTDAEWLMWIDADNTLPLGTIRRLLDTGKSLVTGVYVSRVGEVKPIAYHRYSDGTYENIPEWRRGEIIPVDAAGMGATLTHRSVFEDILKDYRVLSRSSGGLLTVRKDGIIGDIFDDAAEPNDGKVVNGVLQERVYQTRKKLRVPFFYLEMGRTEDFPFYEMAKSVGHQLWLDTSVEVGHLQEGERTIADFRKAKHDEAITGKG